MSRRPMRAHVLRALRERSELKPAARVPRSLLK